MMRDIKINKDKIGKNKPCYIVAELSGNHGGNFNEILKLIKLAKDAGANAIKLQAYTPDTITLNSKKKDFQIYKKHTWSKYKDFYSVNSKKNFRKSPGIHHDNLAFLVGFPRSGTTLIDSILRSHSKTLVLEEKPFLIKIRHKYFKKNSLEKILTISDKEVMKLQSEYFDSFSYSKNKIIIDKFPLNLIEIGFIKRIFPNSKIILALRHPLDSILSCVLTSFKINEAMANYENLNKAAIFYDEVFGLFNIYKSELNFNYYSIKYENLVNKFDNEIKNLLSFLNLDYENSLKNFHITAKNRDKINTPSYNQVTKPIYKDSLERYKKFSQLQTIEPLINKWIKQFNY